MKKINKVIAPLLGISMMLMSGAAVFGDSIEPTAQNEPSVFVQDEPEVTTPDESAGLMQDEPAVTMPDQSADLVQDESEVDEADIEKPDIPLASAPEPSDEVDGSDSSDQVADIDHIKGPSWIEIDKPDIPLDSEAGSSGDENTDVSQTGDSSPLILLSAVMLLAAGAVIVLGIRMREEK